MAGILSPDDLKKKETLKAAAKEEKKSPPGTPAFLQPEAAKPGQAPVVVATPEEVAKAPPAGPVVVVPVEKEDVR